jgi:PIN domain nuclease of toxin-antitoxin system
VLRDPAQQATISASNLAEVIDVMTRIYDRTPALTRDALVLLETAGLRIAAVDADIGIVAGSLHARHYHRKTSPLSMADGVALATSLSLAQPLATSDPALAAAARLEGADVIALPAGRGRRREPETCRLHSGSTKA